MRNDIRREWLGLLIAVLLVVLLVWAMVSCEALNQAQAAGTDQAEVEAVNDQLQDPAGFYQPSTIYQVGRNAYENQIHGTDYCVPADANVLEAMLQFHGQRFAWCAGYICRTFFGYWPEMATLDHGYWVVTEATARSIDYRTLIPVMLKEGSFRSYYYGWTCSGNWYMQTLKTLDQWAYLNATDFPGIIRDPLYLFSVWHVGHYDPYDHMACDQLDLFRACDGGDRQ